MYSPTFLTNILDSKFKLITSLFITLLSTFFFLNYSESLEHISNPKSISTKSTSNIEITSSQDAKIRTYNFQQVGLVENKINESNIASGTAQVIPSNRTLSDEYLTFRHDVDKLVQALGIESLTISDCNATRMEIWQSYKNTEMYQRRGHHLCKKCDSYLEYSKLNTDTLLDLAQNGDFEAMHILGEKYLYDTNTINKGILWLEEAAAMGSIKALTTLESRLFNLSKHAADITEEDKRAIMDKSNLYAALIEYRMGRSVGLETIDDIDNHPKAQRFLNKYNQLTSRRAELGFPQFENVDPTFIPHELQNKCVYLENEMLKNEELNSEFGHMGND